MSDTACGRAWRQAGRLGVSSEQKIPRHTYRFDFSRSKDASQMFYIDHDRLLNIA
jgi:hypothetical protein